jgi:hypothetical protein
MPTGSLLLSIAVCGIFLAFAGVIAWVDHRTTSWQRGRTSDKPTAAKPDRRHRKAA